MTLTKQIIYDIYCEIYPICTKKDIEFRSVGANLERYGFREMCFCLCTPQSNAKKCWQAVEYLYAEPSKGLMVPNVPFNSLGHAGQLFIADALRLHGVRFHNEKAKRIIEAREQWEQFLEGYQQCIEHDEPLDPIFSREWLVENINGYGMKEASHFLRNIGHGGTLAILDRHILRCLSDLHIIGAIPETLSFERYISIEEKMKDFAREVNIPMGHLDMIFWCLSHQEVYK